MDVYSSEGRVDDKVDFRVDAKGFPTLVLGEELHNPDIRLEPTGAELVEDDVLHDVGFFLLAEIEPTIPQPNIGAVIFARIFEIPFPLHIVTERFREKEGIHRPAKIGSDRVVRYADAFDRFHRVGDLCRIGQAPDGRTKIEDQFAQHIVTLGGHMFLYVLQIRFLE